MACVCVGGGGGVYLYMPCPAVTVFIWNMFTDSQLCSHFATVCSFRQGKSGVISVLYDDCS